MRPQDRDGAGVLTNIQKIKSKGHWCPLAPDYITIINSWPVFPTATYIADEKGRPTTPRALARRLKKYVASNSEMAAMEIKPHGLRAMAVCDRRIAGTPHQRISLQIGMTVRQVEHYSRHIDQRLAAGEVQEQNETVKTPGPELKTQTPK